MHGEEMNKELKNRIRELLRQRKLDLQTALQNKQLYEQRLLEVFPIERDPNIEYFYPNTFDGFDNEDCIACRAIFEGKNWSEIDLDILFTKYVQFLILNENGRIYYLPTFLKYYYDLRLINSEFFNSIMGNLVDGLVVPKIDEHEKKRQAKKQGTHIADYSGFDRLTPMQAKLVAVFLVNIANLLPSEWFVSDEAQKALTNYWGKFLLL